MITLDHQHFLLPKFIQFM